MAEPNTPSTNPPPGYRHLRPLGRGGQFEVDLAEDPRGRRVALRRGPSARRVFELTHALHHPFVVETLDHLEHDGATLVVEEFVDGRPWSDVPASGPQELVLWSRCLLHALAYLHDQGVVHGDVSPANVLIVDAGPARWPILVDFGLAGRLGGDERRGGTLGTQAPEVVEGARTSAASDLFALGGSLLAAALSRAPDPRWTTAPESTLEVLPDAPLELHSLLYGLLALDRSHRFPSAHAALRALPPALRTPPLDPTRVPVWLRRADVGALERFLAADAREPRLVLLHVPDGERAAEHVALVRKRIRHATSAALRVAPLAEGTSAGWVAAFLEGLHADDGPTLHLACTRTAEERLALEAAVEAPRRLAIEAAPLERADVERLATWLPVPVSVRPSAVHEETAGRAAAVAARLAGHVPRTPTAPFSPEEIALALHDGPLHAASEPAGFPALGGLLAACQRGLARRALDGAFRIPDERLRDAVLSDTRRAERIAIHARLVDALPPGDERRARHAFLAHGSEDVATALGPLGSQPTDLVHAERALRALLRDAEPARLDADLEPLAVRAIALADRGRNGALLECAERLTEGREHLLPRVQALVARAHFERGELEAARALYDRLATSDGTPNPQTTLDHLRCLERLSDHHALLARLDALPAVVRERLGPVATQIHVLALYRAGRVAEALERGRAGLASVADAQASPHERLNLLQNVAMIERQAGDEDRAAQHFAEAAEGFQRSGDPRASCIVTINAAILEAERGALERTLALRREALALAERLGADDLARIAAAGLGFAEVQAGLYPAALARLAACREHFEATGRPRERRRCDVELERARLALGEADAQPLLALLAEAAREDDPVAAARAWLTLHERDASPPETWTMLRRLRRHAGTWFAERLRLAAIERNLWRGRPVSKAARAFLERRARSTQRRPLAVLAARLLARLADSPAARRTALACALRTARGLDGVEDLLPLHLELVTHHAGAGRAALPRVQLHLRRVRRRLARLERLASAAATETHPMWTETLRRWNQDVQSLTERLSTDSAAPWVEAILRINRTLLAGADAGAETYDAILRETVRLSGASRGAIVFRTPEGLERRMASHDPASDDPQAFHVSRNVIDRVFETGEAVITSDAQEDPELAGTMSAEDFDLTSIICVPLAREDAVIGVLYLDNPFERGRFREGMLHMLQAFATQVTLALTAAQAQRELAERRRELEEHLERRALQVEEMKRDLDEHKAHTMIYQSQAMQRLVGQIRRLAVTDLPVHVHGETGAGKELVARRLHELSRRRDQPFISENCSAIPEELLESELFGHVKGAFTGADREKLGLLRAAHGGTLFLDEIGDMPLELQSKLLRVLQEGEVRPLGSDRKVQVDVRLITATHRDLRQLVEAKTFREDLYYRVHVSAVRVPPLRERPEDVELLARHFLHRHGSGEKRSLDKDALDALRAYPWPGNVRELESVIRGTLVHARDPVITRDDLPEHVREAHAAPRPAGDGSLPTVDLKELEKRAILQALAATNGHRGKAAKLLGIARSSVFAKIDKYGIREVEGS